MTRVVRLVASSARLHAGSLSRQIASARAAWTSRAGVVLALRDGAGRVGLGEASPLPGFSRESAEDCLLVLTSVHERLGAMDLDRDLDGAVGAALRPVDALLAGCPSARFALETALLDLAGQHLGRSIAGCLGGPPDRVIAVNGLLDGSAREAELIASARALLGRGIRTLKRKVGRGAFEDDVALLTALRREVKEPFALRLDANGAWSAAEARERLARLAPLAPEWVEEPASGRALLGLGRAAVAWAADESLADPDFADALLDAPPPGCAAVVLKPALLGGLLRARAMGRRAQTRGLQVVVTHLFDGPVALAAACELALALPELPAACGLDRHAGLQAWPDVMVPQLAQGACVTASGRAGLGLDEAARAALGEAFA